jgi:hypothetical protein
VVQIRAAACTPTEFDPDGDLGTGHHLLPLCLGVIRGAAPVADDANLIEMDHHPLQIEMASSPARPTAARIRPQLGIGGEESGFDQRRMGDRCKQPAGIRPHPAHPQPAP